MRIVFCETVLVICPFPSFCNHEKFLKLNILYLNSSVPKMVRKFTRVLSFLSY